MFNLPSTKVMCILYLERTYATQRFIYRLFLDVNSSGVDVLQRIPVNGPPSASLQRVLVRKPIYDAVLKNGQIPKSLSKGKE